MKTVHCMAKQLKELPLIFSFSTPKSGREANLSNDFFVFSNKDMLSERNYQLEQIHLIEDSMDLSYLLTTRPHLCDFLFGMGVVNQGEWNKSASIVTFSNNLISPCWSVYVCAGCSIGNSLSEKKKRIFNRVRKKDERKPSTYVK